MGVSGILQNAGFVITLFSLIINIICCADREWRKNDPSMEVIETLVRKTGLWERCTFQATGHYQCDDYDAFFIGLPALLTGARVFTCLAIVFGVLSVLTNIVGLDCTKIADGEDQKSQKAKAVVIAGFMALFAGILMCVGICWFAAEVFQNYYNPMRMQNGGGMGGMGGGRQGQYSLEGNEQYIYGRALFFGWSSSLIGIIGGICSICSSWGAMSGDEDQYTNYDNYNAAPGIRNDKSEYL